MILKIKNKSEFISNFLLPLSKLGDSCICKLTDKGLTTLISTDCRTVVLYGSYTQDIEHEGEPFNLNIPDLGRLIRILQCVDSEKIELDVTPSVLKYSSKDIRFSYHLLDDNILSSPKISIDKIKQMNYTTTFDIAYTALVNLLKSSTFTININKVYFDTADDCVYAEINDKQSSNVDNIRIKLCNSYAGADITTPLPVSLDTIRNLAGVKCEKLKISINSDLNVMTFGVNNRNISILYIVSGLIK